MVGNRGQGPLGRLVSTGEADRSQRRRGMEGGVQRLRHQIVGLGFAGVHAEHGQGHRGAAVNDGVR